MNKKEFNTYTIIRDGGGYVIASKTYDIPKTENQLRRLATDYMVNHDISTKYPFHIEYSMNEWWYAGKKVS